MRLGPAIAAALLWASQSHAFCGFYVAQEEGALYNEASKVVFARNGDRSVITMSSDYRGAASDFALVVPTPVVLREDQIRIVEPATISHLDIYTAPRLVEYFDDDPCNPMVLMEMAPMSAGAATDATAQRQSGARALGVTIEAQYAVGDYDILILSARESDGLVTWLRQESYLIPDGAERVLADYIAMGMKFFVARVNLQRHDANSAEDLKPLQIAFRSRNFMLPLQLGKINSAGSQDMLVYMLTSTGRVEAENYRNDRIPSNVNIPSFIEERFPEFYQRTFERAAAPDTVMTEYAWDMAWCDPCAADPMSNDELRELGASWAKGNAQNAGQNVFVTRLHVQYDAATFQRDLMFRETGDRENFQGRYIMNQPFTGAIDCEAGRAYIASKRAQIQAEAQTTRDLTGWSLASIQREIARTVPRRFR